jgi:hypothetical protein
MELVEAARDPGSNEPGSRVLGLQPFAALLFWKGRPHHLCRPPSSLFPLPSSLPCLTSSEESTKSSRHSCATCRLRSTPFTAVSCARRRRASRQKPSERPRATRCSPWSAWRNPPATRGHRRRPCRCWRRTRLRRSRAASRRGCQWVRPHRRVRNRDAFPRPKKCCPRGVSARKLDWRFGAPRVDRQTRVVKGTVLAPPKRMRRCDKDLRRHRE